MGPGADGAAGRCELCRRSVAALTRHHLIPRARHRTPRNRRLFDRVEVKTRVARLCRPCHKQIHVLFDARELEQRYNTLGALREHPEMAKFLGWIRTKPGDLRVRSYRRGERR